MRLSLRVEHRHRSGAGDNRDWFQRDRDRVLYSSAFRRLAGATQVASTSERAVFHNRLTHSLEVAQIGRRLAEHLLRKYGGRLDGDRHLSPDVVEAAALAHDLGHPPFGHLGERVLDEEAKRATGGGEGAAGFEGNAQSFRIVTRLSLRERGVPGLDLTRATGLALMKYPFFEGGSADHPGKYGVYEEDRDAFLWFRKHGPKGVTRTLEAELMDFADDVAYSVHDVYDFTRSGLIPLEALSGDSAYEPFRDYALAFFTARPEYSFITSEVIDGVRERILKGYEIETKFDGSSTHRQTLRQFASRLIREFAFEHTELKRVESEPELFVPVEIRSEVEVMKQLVWFYVIDTPALASQQTGQRRVVSELFHTMLEEIESYGRKAKTYVLPPWAKELLDDGQPAARVACDVVSSLTEVQAAALFRRVTGLEAGLASDPVFA